MKEVSWYKSFEEMRAACSIDRKAEKEEFKPKKYEPKPEEQKPTKKTQASKKAKGSEKSE